MTLQKSSNDSGFTEETTECHRGLEIATGISSGGTHLWSSAYTIIIWFVLITGAIGCVANGLVFLVLVIDKKLKKHSSTFLIKYQMVADFISCGVLVISYLLKLIQNGDGETMKRWGKVICMLFIGDGLVYFALNSATTNLGLIAFERYMKIVHAVVHRKLF